MVDLQGVLARPKAEVEEEKPKVEKVEVEPKKKVFTVEGKTFVVKDRSGEEDLFEVRLSSYEILEDGKMQVNLIHTSKKQSLWIALAGPEKIHTFLMIQEINTGILVARA